MRITPRTRSQNTGLKEARVVRKYAMRGPVECGRQVTQDRDEAQSSMLIYTVYSRIND
jgi:hypothetical protein